jgi:RecB family exonuclease
VITARTTRLVRVPDLQTFRQTVAALACGGTPLDIRNRLVVVPTRAAAAYLTGAIERTLDGEGAMVLPDFVTRDELCVRLAERLPAPTSLLRAADREVLMGVACRAAVDAGAEPPFRLRPALVAEILRFYDTLQLNLKQVDTFERLALGMLEPGVVEDRGAERLAQQTRFLAAAFRAFERQTRESGGIDEHLLRGQLVDGAAPQPWRHVVAAVGDRASDACGLYLADWDLLARIPGLERLDVVATERTVAGVLHERIHQTLPGLEETRLEAVELHAVVRLKPDATYPGPRLIVPAGGGPAHAARDREDEIALFARIVRHDRPPLDHAALVVRRPLPYVYLAREVLRSAGVPSQMFDALPLAAEPFAAALDLVFAAVAGGFARRPAVALLRSPHLHFGVSRLKPAATYEGGDLSALDRALAEAGYLGGLDALEHLLAAWDEGQDHPPAARRAARVLLALARELQPLTHPAPAAAHLDQLLAFFARHERLPDPADPLRPRLLRARAAILDLLTSLRDAYARFDATPVEFEAVAAVVKRWIEGHTFAPHTGDGGVHLVDAESARFGDFELVQLAGLVEGEWPESPRRNIFYPPALLRELGWPSEAERLDGIRAAFSDLLRLPSSVLVVSTFTLEDDAIVAASPLLDALPPVGLDVVERPTPAVRIFEHEVLALDPVETRHLAAGARLAALRRLAAAAEPREPPGTTRGHRPPAYSVSALERYQDCPFKFFAANVLRLEEPLEDEPARSPRARGRFFHEVFQQFFDAWEARGGGAITVDRLDEARALFRSVADPMLARLPDADAALERARLFGSAISTGMADLVLELEASRSEEIEGRWIEHVLEGEFSLGASDGRRVAVRGVADRIDLLAGRRLRVADYKSGYPPDPKRALQVAVYALCAQEQLAARDGVAWTIDEAAYLAFAGKRAVVPVVRSGAPAPDAEAVLAAARTRLFEAVDGVERGEFPPRPHELRLCASCAFPSVCRKDYVGDE